MPAQTRNHDPDFFLREYCRRVARRISRTAFSASSECRSTFDLISAPCAAKMSQKPSLPQSLQTVQLVLTENSVCRQNLLDKLAIDFREDLAHLS